MANPTLNKKFGSLPAADAALATAPVPSVAPQSGEPTMSIRGVAVKTALFLAIFIGAGAWSWSLVDPSSGLTIPVWLQLALYGLFILVIATVLMPALAIVTGPLYAIVEGIVLGGASHILNEHWGGIALQAIIATVAVFIAMLFLFVTDIIEVTERFRGIVIGATFGIFLMYLFSFIGVFFGWFTTPVYSSGPIGIGFSLIVVSVAALNLMLDFDMIVRGVNARMPKQFEWYAAFGLLVTIIWLYFEILILLAKIRD